MNTFLFAWNPERWDWTDLEKNIEELEKTGRVAQMWSCVSHKLINIGDRVFLIKLGRGKRGIIGAGFFATSPFLSPHWDNSGKMAHRVIVDFEALLNPKEDSILSMDLLKQGNLNSQHWSSQASGISIKSELTEELESVWFDFLTTQNIRFNPFKNNDSENQKTYTEGTPNQVRLTKYERNPHARKKCIEHFGLSCQVCELNFEKTYGEIGKDFIHVHHISQLANIGKTYEVNPLKDLIPVCPNCHSMIHKRKKAYSIEEMKKIHLEKKSSH